MNKPISIVLLSLAAWGWLSQTWVIALLIIVMVAINPLIAARWNLDRKQFYRFTDFCVVLLLLFLSWAYLFGSEGNPIFTVLAWAPVIVAPILFAQLYSTSERVPPGTLFYSMRGARAGQMADIDIQYPYALIVVLSASSANTQDLAYFAVAGILLSMILLLEKSSSTGRLVLAGALLAVLSTAYFAQIQLKLLHRFVEEKSIEWLSDGITDPFKSRTSIGDIGKLKLSNRILLRVRAEHPMLLLQTSYEHYLGKEWFSSSPAFTDFEPVPATSQGQKDVRMLEVYQAFRADTMLALPAGVQRITGLEEARLQSNDTGSIKLKKPPGEARYQVFYDGANRWPPQDSDRVIPEQHLDWMQQVGDEIGLKDKSPLEAVSAIRQFFFNRFKYSLYTPRQTDADSALRHFIQERKAGHCEYFAVASVFLLRQAGIAARLANGYSMQEYDENLGLFTVRGRHAHAWALAFIDGRWIAVDPTPSEWLQMEADQSNWLDPLFDWASRQWFIFNLWRADPDADQERVYLTAGALILLVLYLIYLVLRNRNTMVREGIYTPQKRGQTIPGTESEFYLIEQQLKQILPARTINQSLMDWINGLNDPVLGEIMQLHYRLRFDPNKISAAQRRELRDLAQRWNKAH